MHAHLLFKKVLLGRLKYRKSSIHESRLNNEIDLFKAVTPVSTVGTQI